jgi:hypothetical protein
VYTEGKAALPALWGAAGMAQVQIYGAGSVLAAAAAAAWSAS